jgi:hypothetical protein
LREEKRSIAILLAPNGMGVCAWQRHPPVFLDGAMEKSTPDPNGRAVWMDGTGCLAINFSIFRPMNSKWQDELSDAKLREYAGATVFARGREYAHEGCAVLVRDGRTSTTWTVAGTHRYQVELDLEENELHANCTCPYAEEHGFCKHMVAAALSWRAHLGGAPLPLAASSAGAASAKSAERAAARAAKHDALQAFLLAQPAHDLARHLLSWAEQDRDLMAVLRAWQAEAKAGDTPGGWKEVLTTLLKNRQEFLDGGDCRRYAQRGMQAVALLQKLVDGHSAATGCRRVRAAPDRQGIRKG